jgi:hypothetical protein
MIGRVEVAVARLGSSLANSHLSDLAGTLLLAMTPLLASGCGSAHGGTNPSTNAAALSGAPAGSPTAALYGRWTKSADCADPNADNSFEFLRSGTVISGDYAATYSVPEPGRLIVNTSGLSMTATYQISGNRLTLRTSAGDCQYEKATSGAPPEAPKATVPGGLWVSPDDGFATTGNVHFAAHAYPTNRGGAAIQSVNFTVKIASGPWTTACAMHTPTPGTSDLYECEWSVPRNVSNADIVISFDVYDTAGRVNRAPNGERTGTVG